MSSASSATTRSRLAPLAACLALLLPPYHAPADDPTPSAAAPRHGRTAALAQMRRMKVAEGLEATLFACEPMIRNPANLDIDARGRVWCTEGVNYRTWQKWGKLQPAGDRIVILEDTDLDGVADVEKTFYQGNEINAALGICVLGNRVIVSCSPNVLVFEDLDGDDRADGPPKRLFTGIGGVEHDHGVHAVVFGPDGRLYFNFGNEGRQILDAAGRQVKDLDGVPAAAHGRPYRQGLLFRCDPDGSHLETLGWNFRNPYEVALDSFGNLWQSDNDDDGNQGVRFNFVLEYGNYGYTDEMTGAGWPQKRSNLELEIPRRHWHLNDPGVVPNLLQTGAGSPTGLCLYEGDLLPEVFRGQPIHCDAGPRVVRAYPLEKQGAGYQARIVDLLSSEDDWFRPSDVGVAPDGSLFVADWNDAGVGGHNMADQVVERMTGRIYRLAPKGHRPSTLKPAWGTPQEAVRALRSPNLATRYLGFQSLAQAGAAAETDLQGLWRDPNPRLRARALHLLVRLPGKSATYLGQAISDPVEDLRLVGVRIARQHGLDLMSVLQKLVDDSSPQVRREVAVALRHSKSPEAPKLWARLAAQHDGQDRWYLEALGIGADGQWDSFLAARQTGDDLVATQPGRDLIWRSRAKATSALLAKIIAAPGTPEADKPRYFRAFDFQVGPEKDAALLQLLALPNPGQ